MALQFRSRGPYSWLSNFSRHPITMNGLEWPSVEHYFQAMKFPHEPARQERIRQKRNPLQAKRIAWERGAKVRPGWERLRDRVMLEAVRAKFEQHSELREALLETGSQPLVEHSRSDAYWGDGGDGRGKNKLGRILMQIREEMRAAE
ncbi:MAG: DUF1768 domain-containing protein [Candidatus Eisenbacteria bacterium]|nr:DUF1768 domain-containing protein [Candidatus Eisenbacteria bacterium]